MVYVTLKQSPRYKQMSLDEFLSMDFRDQCREEEWDTANTRTYVTKNVSEKLYKSIDLSSLMDKLIAFNANTETLRAADRHDLYRVYKIPKSSGGLRKISEPNPELMNALRCLKTIFEKDFRALYHTSAFAYIKKRCVVDDRKRHQRNESKWFAKFDLKDFFDSTNIEFVSKMFSVIFPFSEVMKTERGKEEMMKALELCFLDGGLPQGSPISPLITNIMMIPIDHALANKLSNYNGQRYVYTRYADDFTITSKYTFRFKEIEQYIKNTLESFDAPFTIKPEKTRYGSTAGANWGLGLMLNKDNEITVGHKKKKQLQNMLHAYIMDRKNGVSWDLGDIQSLQGSINWIRMVEGDVADRIVNHMNEKMGCNIYEMIREDLSPN